MKVVVVSLRRRGAHLCRLLLSKLLYIYIIYILIYIYTIYQPFVFILAARDGRGTHHRMAIVPEECLVTSIYVEAGCTRYPRGRGVECERFVEFHITQHSAFFSFGC